jgi:ankyrin repeat protein
MKICRYLGYTLLLGIALSSTMLASITSPEVKYGTLLSKNIEVDEFGVPFLVIEASKGDVANVKYLLEHIVNQSHDNKALLEASARGHDEIVKCLLLHGAEIETRDFNGDTSLALAVRAGHVAVAQVLLAAKASMYTTNKQGQSPEDILSETKNIDLRDLFIQARMDRGGFGV